MKIVPIQLASSNYLKVYSDLKKLHESVNSKNFKNSLTFCCNHYDCKHTALSILEQNLEIKSRLRKILKQLDMLNESTIITNNSTNNTTTTTTTSGG